MSYRKLFDPGASAATVPEPRSDRLGDRSKRLVYVYDDNIVLAVNVALASGRPLLVSGDPGTGKSSLARAVATKLGWRFLSQTISSRTRARDLLWTFETVRRLSDAQTKEGVRHAAAYLSPGVLWWAFDAASASRRGLTAEAHAASKLPLLAAGDATSRVVVLLDEIDKADPDVPNDLLEPLGSFQFRVLEGDIDCLVTAPLPPLVFITTNDERDLPKAFLRRCVSITLAAPDRARLVAIAAAHFPEDAKNEAGQFPLHEQVVDAFLQLRKRGEERPGAAPSTAEYLDAISACRELSLVPGTADWDSEWPRIEAVALGKRRET